MDKRNKSILWFDQLNNDDVAFVGGKNASLGEMYVKLSAKGIKVPNGFVVTAHAYREIMKEEGLDKLIQDELEGWKSGDVTALAEKGKKIRDAFVKEKLPEKLSEEIKKAYKDLSNAYGEEQTDVAVRSSATAEDLPGASFAGQHETFLNVKGEEELLIAIKKAMASLFTDRAISYRVDKGFSHFDVALSVGVQKMVRSDKGSSGVMFTLDTETGFRDLVQISASWGLGEMVVQGKINPDEYLVFKPTLDKGFSPIIKKSLGEKTEKMIYTTSKTRPVKEVKTTKKEQESFVLSEEDILTLAGWGVKIEKHYSERWDKDMPMDIEWAKDGISGDLFIVQARPETVRSEEKKLVHIEHNLLEEGTVITEGAAVGTKIATGKARVIKSAKNINEFKEGEILITYITDPDWEPIMKQASAIITDRGGRTSHAAIVSRELGIPAVIGTSNATKKIKTGDEITVDTSSGTVGRVYKGTLKWEEKRHDVSNLPKTKTKICMNIGSPENAFAYSSIPNDGVGLAREEFIIASHIKVHPNALINFSSLSPAIKKKVNEATKGYEDKKQFYIDKLAEGVGQIGAAFWPNEVIVRFSDFKTNEYATLIGGSKYEPEEENPMIGWRGASRYVHPDFSEAFRLECKAIKKVREVFGLTNVSVMVPFCRTPEEGIGVLNVLSEEGLKKGDNGLRVHVMCEIPTNVIRADEFLEIFDGFSIGSNDLAQLTLGLDRDSNIVAGISNENDPAVKDSISKVIRKCKEKGKYIGFCGQAPSDYPDFLRFLVKEGIEAVSLSPDTIIPMKYEVAEEEENNN